ncbi:MAG: N-6 DNA methylase [Methylocystis sp.]
MDLFISAGMDLPIAGGKAARPRQGGGARSLRAPLFAYKVLEEARGRVAFTPTREQIEAASEYARMAKKNFGKLTEDSVRPIFFSTILEKLLGYRTADPDAAYSLAFERPIRHGKVDVALGRFQEEQRLNEIVAPFEFKGPKTVDLDAPMPGRGRSPVQQAWDYAIDTPGARWALASNCLEIRLYGFGRGRDAYEVFDLTKLDDPEEHAKLWLLLSEERFLGGAVDALLQETDSAYRDVTEELYKQYSALRDRLIDFLVNTSEGPKVAAVQAIEIAQKLLDRVLFIAFAQRTDLLPDKLLERAVKATNEFDPQPIWTNFRGLFRMVDRGHYDKAIPAYNGGLFAADPVVDVLTLPDPLATDVAALGEWDYRREVPVTVLGHIFEQSINDIERLKSESRGEAPPPVSRRKREGVVYTPDMVTRFLVERTIGVALRKRFDAGWKHHACDRDNAPQPQFWRAYLTTLRGFTIIDPACGSGAFLVAAFDALAAEYQRAAKALEGLGEPIDFDIFDEIVTRNLFGVDLNAESVEITRLSLWLKTARRDHRLQNLENTIRVGDSLIDDKTYTSRPFDWRAAFPEAFDKGGFDVVIGNPPYVRMEFIKAVKPYLEKHYVVAADRADLYAYFFERGVRLLKPGGRLGFISSSTFFRTGSGENLRKFLTGGVSVECVVDFGDLQIFEGVTTYPAILTLRKDGALPHHGEAVSSSFKTPASQTPQDEKTSRGELSFLVVDEIPQELGRVFEERAHKMPLSRLTAGSWRFEEEPLAKLRDKIKRGRKTLGEVYGAPLYGIKTGLNEAFVIDTPTRDRLVKADKKSAELLKPFLRGEDVKRWRVEPQGLWLINTPKGKVDIEKYSAIRDWLMPFKSELEKRATKQEWWELQQAQLAYQLKFEAVKIVYQDITCQNPFSVESTGAFLGNTCYFLDHCDFALLAYLNSRIAWFVLSAVTNIARGGYLRLRTDFVEKLPIPELSERIRKKLSVLSETSTKAAGERYEIQSAVRRRILDLAPPERAKLTGKLGNWHTLTFQEFRAAVKQAFRVDIPLKERADWEAHLAENSARVLGLTTNIEAAEREIDKIVYALFDLTPDEIALLEASLADQY